MNTFILNNKKNKSPENHIYKCVPGEVLTVKTGKISHLAKTLLLAVLFLITTMAVRGATIVGFNLTANNNATSYIAGNSGCRLNTNAAFGGYGGNGEYATGWNGGSGTKYWTTTSFTTIGYVGLTVSAQMMSVATGPRDFKLQYSLNGTSWADVGYNFSITASLGTSYSTSLPIACENQSTVYVRWLMASSSSVAGGTVTTSTAKSYIYGISIAGDLPATPSTQSSNIKIVAVTETTITLGCTQGNGSHRIIEINNTNSFGAFSYDNNNPSANENYSGTGEQVVYNGSGSMVTVTVPSANYVYWISIFEYNYNSGMIRYNITQDTANVKRCALETINTPTFSNIGDTTATVGATIVTPTAGTIADRGIFWNTYPDITNYDNQESDGGTSGGTFAFAISDLTPNSTIYFKAYVTNEHGTILSEESSFSNVSPEAPTGDPTQGFCVSARISDLAATGTLIKWYNTSTGGSALSSSTALVNGNHYYASQTINSRESSTRLDVAATVTALPTISSTTPGSRTGTGAVTLGAAASAGTINWYASASGGSSLGTGTSFTTPSISSTTNYYVDATLNGCTTASRSSVTATIFAVGTYVWTGLAGTTDWSNTGNWSSNAVPGNTNDVAIPTHPTGGNIFPAVTANSQCKNITISTGASLSVNSGKNLSVYGNFANSGTSTFGNGTITMCGASAQTISGTNTFTNLAINNTNGVSLSGTTEITDILTPTAGTLTTNGHLTLLSDLSKFAIISGTGSGSVSGSVSIQKQFNSYKRYFYISSPVSSTFSQLQSFLNITGWGASYKNGGWSNIWKYDETDISQVSHPDGVRMNGWIAPGSGSDAMQTVRGYALYVDAVKTAKLSLTGSVNNGPVSYSVTHTSSVSSGGSAGDDGWNLVGNPYPSAIDWEASGWTKTNVDNATYFFEGGLYKSFVNGIGVPSGVTGIIGPMQGFFVHASANGTIGINNNARVNNVSPYFYKKANVTQLIRLRTYNKNTPDATDETVVYFNANSSFGFDNNYDALKIMNTGDSYPSLYSMTESNTKLSIYAIPQINDTTVVIPLGIKIPATGSYILDASEINNIDVTTEIYLVDMLTNTSQDMRANTQYAFDLNKDVTEGRFFLKLISKIEATGIKNQEDNSIFHTFISGKTLNMSFSSSLNKEATLHIYNLMGQKVVNTQKLNNGIYQYNMNNGTYILRLISENKTYTKKIVIE